MVASGQTVARLEVYPSERTLYAPNRSQQLAVIAHFDDGTQRDVTRLTAFHSSDSLVASVTLNGKVRFHQTGEVAILCRYGTVQGRRLTFVDAKPGFVWPNPPQYNWIDRHVFARLQQFQITPSDLCSDEIFIRRAFLDACGILPTPTEVRQFLADSQADKRVRLIESLLARPEFADVWAHHFVEPLGLTNWHMKPMNGAAYLHWMRSQIANDVPMDRIVRDMLLGKTVVTQHGPVSFYSGGRTPPDWAQRTAANFLGLRLQCVRCHAQRDSRWTPDDYHGLAAFFSQVYIESVPADGAKTEVLLQDRQRNWLHPDARKVVSPRFLGGINPTLKPMQDRREVLADWLTSPKNPYFARTMANRIWHHLLGKGIAHPPETLHERPLSANDPLLDALAHEFIDKRFDLKHLVRVIMNSRTYQLSSKANDGNKDDDKYFSRAYMPVRKTEVLLDALSQFLEMPDEYEGMPAGTRAVRTLHTAPRGLAFFPRGHRIAVCEDEESASSDRGNPVWSAIHSDELQKRLKDPSNRIGRLLMQKRTNAEIFDELWLAGLAKLPPEPLRTDVIRFLDTAKNRRVAIEDLAWAVIASTEFFQRR